MNNYPFIKAHLISKRKIQVMVFSSLNVPNNAQFKLYNDAGFVEILNVLKKAANTSLFFYELEASRDIDLESEYFISVASFPFVLLDISQAIYFDDFDEMYSYDGKLGLIYHDKYLEFYLWAPLAHNAILKIKKEKEEKFNFYPMQRKERGIFYLRLEGRSFKGALYHYLVENNGILRETNDPYARFTNANSKYSIVEDIKDIETMETIPLRREYQSYNDLIIYETNVRDLTEDRNSNIVNKGKYLGFVEEHRKSKGGHPAGLDYLKYLGITHVQLNPILDFNTIDDLNPDKKYNWGYDPISMFAIEGSYSKKPDDGLERLKEFKTMVNKLHENGIGVIIDVVYNHIYEHLDSSLEKTVPNYYFRRKKDFSLSEASGCGNDVASERLMARRIIVESTKYLVSTFDIDGFRFDLMGLLDIETMNEIYQECKKIKKNLIFYGEGWNMNTALPFAQRACADNYQLLPNFAFFNEMYRDIMKGPTFSDQLYKKGYINGDSSYHFGAAYSMLGSVVNSSYEPKFRYAHQSINYLECHDNNTLFDKLSVSNSEESEETIKKRISLGNDLLMISQGVPLIHMGQEVGQTKYGLDNTYNVLKVNRMDWANLDDNFEMVNHLKLLIDWRKQLKQLDDPTDIEKTYKFTQLENDILCVDIDGGNISNRYKKIKYLINVTNHIKTLTLDDYYYLYGIADQSQIKEAIISPCSLLVLYKI